MTYAEKIKGMFDSQEKDNFVMCLVRINGVDYADWLNINLPGSTAEWEQAHNRMTARMKRTINKELNKKGEQ